jgi:hypothetical protein
MRSTLLASGLSVLLFAPWLRADEPTPDFAADVAPILKAHCAKCHGTSEPKAKLDLSTAQTLSRGGESGPIVVPGHPDDSLLWQMLADGSMPPEDEPKLAAADVELVRRWIAAGAPGFERSASADPSSASPEARRFWAFQPLAPPAVPPVRAADQVRTAVDAFVLKRLEEHDLGFAQPADRAALLRRLSLDLVGLPPAPERLTAFLADESPDAYERLVDELLASPHFGERWGRHWLDDAGYSDITGGDNDAGIIKLSEGKWKYRDYVVRAHNQDKPYAEFLTEQLAGDELVDWRTAPSFTPRTEELLVATGFLRNAADDTDEKELATPDIQHGILQRTGEVVANNLLGLTLACAKCHDHKYEPIAQREYYGFLAAFTPIFNVAAWLPPKLRALADIAPVEKSAAEKHNAEVDRQVAEMEKQQAEIKRPARRAAFEARLAALPEAIRADVKRAVETAKDKRGEVEKYLADKFAKSLEVADAEVESRLEPAQKDQLAQCNQRIAAVQQTRRAWGTIQAAYEVGPPPETRILRRGNHETPGAAVEPGFFAVLCSTEAPSTPSAFTPPSSTPPPKPVGQTSGRRLALAHWLTDHSTPAGALAARVRVNRVWQHLFGKGIVETSENLGQSGARPTHPELVDWLAARYVAEGGRLKPFLKLLVTSTVYRQSSSPETAHAAALSAADPSNRLLGRMPLKRLEAEIVRDAILSASGQLDLALGGPSLALEVQPDGMVVLQTSKQPRPTASSRRSLYVLARRNYHLSLLGVFDQPAMSTNCPNRQQSAVVLQSLTMLNDAQVIAAAERFAARVLRSTAADDSAAQIDFAFRVALGRSPSGAEMSASQELLSSHAADLAGAEPAAEHLPEQTLAHLCHMLLGASEFLYVP